MLHTHGGWEQKYRDLLVRATAFRQQAATEMAQLYAEDSALLKQLVQIIEVSEDPELIRRMQDIPQLKKRLGET